MAAEYCENLSLTFSHMIKSFINFLSFSMFCFQSFAITQVCVSEFHASKIFSLQPLAAEYCENLSLTFSHMIKSFINFLSFSMFCFQSFAITQVCVSEFHASKVLSNVMIVNSIIHVTGMAGPDVQEYVTNFEQLNYDSATSQLDYATRIAEEVSSFEKNFSVHLDISDCDGGQNPSGLASSLMQLHQCQVQQQLPMTTVNPSQAHPQILRQNIIPSAVQNSENSSSTASLASFVGPNSSLYPNMGGFRKNSESDPTDVQEVHTNVFGDTGSHQQLHGSHIQAQNVVQQYNMYQTQQLPNQFEKQGNVPSSMLQIPLQQQVSLFRSNEVHVSQDSHQHDYYFQHQLKQSHMMQPQNIHHSSVQEQDQQSSQMMVQQPSSHGIKQIHAQIKTGVQDGQQHLIQALTGLPEASSSEVQAYNGSAAQTSQNAIDWLEEVYKKLQKLKDKYFVDVHGIYARVNDACERFGAGERKISFRNSLGNILNFLNMSKSDIISMPDFEVNLASCEKQILRVIKVDKKPIPKAQQPNTPTAASLSITSHLQQLDNQTQSNSMQSSAMTSLYEPLATPMGAHHSQLFRVNVSQPAQNVMNSLQRSIKGGSLSQPNKATLKSSASIIREHNLKQQREQNWKRELLIENQQRKQQVNELEQQHQQQFHQPGQMPKVPQIYEISSDPNELTKQPELHQAGIFPLHHQQSQPMQHIPQSGQMNISYPQFLQSESHQKSQESAPQIDQQNLVVGTNFAGSPSTFLFPEVACVSTAIATPTPSVSHSPTAVLSPINTEQYSPSPKKPCVSNSGNMGSQQAIQENTPSPFKPSSPDRVRSDTGNEYIPVGGEDLAVMTGQKRPSRDSPDGSSPSAKKIKIDVDATLLNALSPVGDRNSDNFRLSSSFEAPELESSATSSLLKVNEAENNNSLVDEIEDTNLRITDTIVEMSDPKVGSVAEATTDFA